MTAERLGDITVAADPVLTRAVDEFAAAWAARPEPDIADFLPSAADIRRSVLVDLVRIDIRNRGAAKRLIDYCTEFPDLRPSDLPIDLIYEEFVVRRHSGQAADARVYIAEFPDQSAELTTLLNSDDEPSTQAANLDDATAFTEPTGFAEPTFGDEPTRFGADDESVTVARPADPTDPGTSPIGSGGNPLDEITEGQRIDDFDLLTPLGSGAFARVFLARQRSIQRIVAVKVSADRGTEPQTLAQLDHDYIVRIFDQRKLTRRGLKLLYMQFLPGGTLLQVLRCVRATPQAQRSGELLLDAIDAAMAERGAIRPTESSVRAQIATLTWPETVAWLGQRLAEALEYAGSRGVLHRDVKPANILLTAEGVPKLADFNISFSRAVEGASAVAYFGGSLSYMSPEQLEACHPGRAASAADLDTRSDIYSLGVVLWELLTGRKPFGNELESTTTDLGDTTTLDLMIERRRTGVPAEALDTLPPDCPATLRRVLLACLQPARQNRWSSGKQLAQQLDLCLDPRARDLVDPPEHSWRRRLRGWILPVLLLALGIPNVLASVYNIHHNQTLIISQLPDSAQLEFGIITQVINGTFFPIGAALILYLCRYLFIVSRGLRRGRRFDAQAIAAARSDALRVGDRAVLIIFGAWVLAGAAFPVTLRLVSGTLPTEAYVHFVMSLVVCGAIAVVYPFFLVNFYIVRCVYPAFLPFGDTGEHDIQQLRALDRRCNLFLALAAVVPLLAVTSATFVGPSELPKVVFAVRVVSVVCIVAFALAYALFRMIEHDIRALERVVAHGSLEASRQ